MLFVWQSLTPFSQEYYNNSIQNLLDENINNLLIVGVYHIVDGVLIVGLFGVITNMEGLMQNNWRPELNLKRLTINFSYINEKENQEALEDGFVLLNLRKQYA